MRVPSDVAAVAAQLARAGFLAPDDEADQLLAAAGEDAGLLQRLLGRRLTGEPLAWVTGSAIFCDQRLRVHAGVYVPRWHSESLARRAVERLPEDGVAIDLCTGCGAVARVLMSARPRARVLASDVDPAAVACARDNGVEASCGDLFEPFGAQLAGCVDLVTAVVPYVPTAELPLLQRDTFTFETPLAYDGGPDGLDVLRRVITTAPTFLRPGAALLLELGGDQADRLADELSSCGYGEVRTLSDEDGDVRGVEATWYGPSTAEGRPLRR